MAYRHDRERQKSLKRRFLLILGATTAVTVMAFGLMVIFWDRMQLPFTNWQRIAIGVAIIIYAILRFARLFKKDPYDERI